MTRAPRADAPTSTLRLFSCTLLAVDVGGGADRRHSLGFEAMRLPCILTIAALLRASGQPRNATTAQARRRLQGGGVTAVVITVHNALASTIDCLEALVATARGSVRLKVVLVLDNCD